jgi:hypothetical protein
MIIQVPLGRSSAKAGAFDPFRPMLMLLPWGASRPQRWGLQAAPELRVPKAAVEDQELAAGPLLDAKAARG